MILNVLGCQQSRREIGVMGRVRTNAGTNSSSEEERIGARGADRRGEGKPEAHTHGAEHPCALHKKAGSRKTAQTEDSVLGALTQEGSRFCICGSKARPWEGESPPDNQVMDWIGLSLISRGLPKAWG